MVNFGFSSATILGIFLALAGAGLYLLRSFRPELSRDQDIFFAAVGLLCGLILFFQGWRLDPILQFGQFLLTGSTIFFAVETIRLRSATTEQAKRNTPIVERDRRVSKTYAYTEAELDQIEPEDEDEDQYYNKRRLRGDVDPRNSRESGYNAEESRRPRTRRPSEQDPGRESQPKRRPRSGSPTARESYDTWEEPSDMWEEKASTRRPRSDREAPPEDSSRPPRKRRSRPASDDIYSTQDATPTDYVDYYPVDEPEQGGQDWESDSPPPEKPKRERPSRSDGGNNEDNPVRFDY